MSQKPLHIYNTLSRTKEEFVPLQPGRVGMYVCGPTVYGHSHIGHAKSYVSFDVIVRYLRYRGFDVNYVQNITDVGHLVGDAEEGEDKVQQEAKQLAKSPYAIAQFYERSYWEDMDRLNLLRPDISCRATGHIMEQIELIQSLIDKGYAYDVNGSVYYDVGKDKDYGKLSNRRVEDMEAGARVGVRDEKRSPYDFALWKRAEENHLMRWPSPWGVGFPGWHVECSAMAMKYLGKTFDIHGGGIENQFPHHECEIAQSESATGQLFVKYWMHNNMVTVEGKKMGKSMGNASNLKDLFSHHDPLALRYFILQSHYRSTLEFNEAAISAAAEGLKRLHATVRRLRGALRNAPDAGTADAEVLKNVETLRTEFERAMDDDFNAPIAIGVLSSLSTLSNTSLDKGGVGRAALQGIDQLFDRLGGTVLGVVPENLSQSGGNTAVTGGLIELFIAQRNHARANKDWKRSDEIRDELAKLGVVLEDGPGGTTWRLA